MSTARPPRIRTRCATARQGVRRTTRASAAKRATRTEREPGEAPARERVGGSEGRSPSVIFEEVSKFYGEVLGVNRVTLNIPPGITSLVGPNGAGKTTLMNLMTGLIFPDHGRILMRGISPRDPEALMRMTGYATQYHGAALGHRVHLHHHRAASVRIRAIGSGGEGLEGARARESDRGGEPQSRGVSKGMRQRVRLAQAIAHDPDLLVLDEPLNGLDPLVRAETIDLFRSWAAEGKHVILSSHVLQEVDVISDQVVLIANGMIVAEGKIRTVRDEIDEHPSQYIVRCRDRDASGVAALLFSEEHITEIKLNDDRLGMLVMTRDREQFARALGRIALDGHRIESVVPADENVDALYQVPDRRQVVMTLQFLPGSGPAGVDDRKDRAPACLLRQALFLDLRAGAPAVADVLRARPRHEARWPAACQKRPDGLRPDRQRPGRRTGRRREEAARKAGRGTLGDAGPARPPTRREFRDDDPRHRAGGRSPLRPPECQESFLQRGAGGQDLRVRGLRTGWPGESRAPPSRHGKRAVQP